jgi:DNA-directed RNA polymerase specialized sigma24 family protein
MGRVLSVDPQRRLTVSESSSIHGPVVRALIEILQGSSDPDQQDAIMQTLLELLENEVDGEVIGADLDSSLAHRYAMRAIQNQLLGTWRERRRLGPLGEQATPPLTISRELNELEKAVIDETIREMAPDDHALLNAYFEGGEQLRAECDRQSISPETARVRIHRRLKRLRVQGLSLTTSGK